MIRYIQVSFEEISTMFVTIPYGFPYFDFKCSILSRVLNFNFAYNF